MKDLVKPGERIDDLQLNGLRIIQNPEGFCFGIDAVLVSNFCEIRRGDAVVDLGTGTGVIPLLIAGKSGAGHITGFEIQEEVGDMARRSVALNGLEERVSIVTDSFLHAERYLKAGSAQVVVSNPPYVARGAGIHNQGSLKTGSRHEVHCTFEDVAQTASRLLQQGGRFYLVHRPDRLADVIAACRARQLEPKTIRFVQPKPDTAPNLFLMKCVKGAAPSCVSWRPWSSTSRTAPIRRRSMTSTAWNVSMSLTEGEGLAPGLYLCPTPIGNLEDITLRALRVLAACDVVAAEDTRHSLKLLNHYGIRKRLLSCHEHNSKKRGPEILEEIRAGHAVALVSDAGMPGISDPGADILRLCVAEGLPVTVLPGPSASLTALVASGLRTDRFTFWGFRNGRAAAGRSSSRKWWEPKAP